MRIGNATPIRLDIPPKNTVLAPLRVRAEKRGWLELETVTISTLFPLGIFYAWSPINLKYRILVYPRPSRERLPFPRFSGARVDASAGSASDDFQGFRAYHAGDPLKRIHWKSLAKGLDPLIKQYSGGETETLRLSWSATEGTDTEARLSRLCRWVLDAEQARMRYSLDLPGIAIPAGRGASF